MAKRKINPNAKVEQVNPLTSTREIKAVQKVLLTQGMRKKDDNFSRIGRRNEMLFTFGIYTGLRVSDIIKLKVKDIKQSDLSIREQKTGKATHAHINRALRSRLDTYLVLMDLTQDDWLFPSTRGNNHVTRFQVYRMIHDAGLVLGRNDLGSHTMRKTFGRMWVEQGKSLPTLQQIFNHTSQRVTLHYIGLTQDDINKQIEDFDPLA